MYICIKNINENKLMLSYDSLVNKTPREPFAHLALEP